MPGDLATAASALAAAGCDTPRLDAELLLAHSLGTDRAGAILHGGNGPPPAAFGEYVERRARREPVAYIVGRKAFRRIELLVDPRVLIPRPETETLVEAALELLPREARVHDVGTGSGCVALALKDERPDLVVSGSDASAAAIDVARSNADRLGIDVELVVASGLPGGEFDLVTANLPYVREDEWDTLAPEITIYEPREALVAGADGLDAIRTLVGEAVPGTSLALEHAPDQAAAVRLLLHGAETRRDLAGRERVTVGAAP